MDPKIVSLIVALISFNSVFAQTPTSACEACVSNINNYFDTADNTCKYAGNLLGFPFRNFVCDITIASVSFSPKAVCNSFNCPRDPPPTFTYNEHNAKNVYWRLQGALKLDPTSPTFINCTKNAASDIVFVKRINVTCGVPLPIDTCITDVYVIPSLLQILTISRGSNGLSQVAQMAFTLAAPIYSFSSNGTAVTYFQNAVKKTWDGGLGAELESLLKNATYSGYKFVAAGHSLGGPQAILFAALVGQNEWRATNEIEVYTTGQPRLGDLKYMKSVSQYAPQIYRIINNVDLIPITPLRTLGNVQHTDWTIRYIPSMTSSSNNPRIQCTWPEQPECMGYNVIESLSESNHNTYFGQDVTSFYETGCVY